MLTTCHGRLPTTSWRGRPGWLTGRFPWAHGRTIITTRAEWVQQREDSREVSGTDLQHCDWHGAGSLTMLKCGKCRLVYNCSIDCQKAARSQHKCVCIACVPVARHLAQRRLRRLPIP